MRGMALLASTDSTQRLTQCPLGLVVLWSAALVSLVLVVSLSLSGTGTAPSLPAAIQLSSQRASAPTFPNLPCVAAFNRGSWERTRSPLPCSAPRRHAAFATCDAAMQPLGAAVHWKWATEALAPPCGAHHIDQQRAQSMLGKRWVAVAGDSIARLAFGALLRRLSSDGSQQVSGRSSHATVADAIACSPAPVLAPHRHRHCTSYYHFIMFKHYIWSV